MGARGMDIVMCLAMTVDRRGRGGIGGIGRRGRRGGIGLGLRGGGVGPCRGVRRHYCHPSN